MQHIISHIESKYEPLCIVLYGSYADGTFNAQSDFDCLIITQSKDAAHDSSVIDGVQLDLFIHTQSEVDEIDCIPLFDAKVIKDTGNIAAELVQKARNLVANSSKKSNGEKQALRAWLHKMLARAKNDDADGLYRRHWLLTDALEIYFDLRDRFYFGPKKAIAALRHENEAGFALFTAALSGGYDDVAAWVAHVIMEC